MCISYQYKENKFLADFFFFFFKIRGRGTLEGSAFGLIMLWFGFLPCCWNKLLVCGHVFLKGKEQNKEFLLLRNLAKRIAKTQERDNVAAWIKMTSYIKNETLISLWIKQLISLIHGLEYFSQVLFTKEKKKQTTWLFLCLRIREYLLVWQVTNASFWERICWYFELLLQFILQNLVVGRREETCKANLFYYRICKMK